MDLEKEVRAVMSESRHALTVDQVTSLVADRLRKEVKTILNRLAAGKELDPSHGGGSYQTAYTTPKIQRRV
jgi:hypothetical protein